MLKQGIFYTAGRETLGAGSTLGKVNRMMEGKG
jgi:hypothetical protein